MTEEYSEKNSADYKSQDC